MGEISIGQYALPVIITVVMGIVYKVFERPDGSSFIPDRWKTLIVIAVGIGLGLLGMVYNSIPWIAKNVIENVMYGFMSGCSAIGIWKGLGAVNTGGGK